MQGVMMLSVIIRNDEEEKVVQMTYQNIWKEIKDIPDVELLVQDHWDVDKIKNRYVCFLESDCLVNSGYFESQLSLLQKNPMFRKIAMLTSSTAVNDWANKFYGYSIGDNYVQGIIPNKEKKSRGVYAVQIGFVPGAIIHVGMLKKALRSLDAKNSWEKDPVFLSTQLSLAFWQ
jgi:hypothetical protein